MTEEQVRKELREWRKQEHAINACIEARERMQKQVQILIDFGMLAEADKVSKQIEMLNIEKLIENAKNKRENYIKAIDRLNDIDKTIIVESIINGKSYMQLSRTLAYSEANIKWLAKNAIKKICAYLTNLDNEKV